MTQRTWVLLGIFVLVAAGAGWYFFIYRSASAEGLPSESSLDLTTEAELKGSPGNEATLENVTVEADGTIKLAPTQ